MAKHEYTCPDIIYLRKRAKRNALIQLGLVAALATAAGVTGWWTERQDAKLVKTNLKVVAEHD